MSTFERLSIGIKSIRQLGLEPVGLYALYQIGLRSGYYRWRTPLRPFVPVHAANGNSPRGPFHLPQAETLRAILGTTEADLRAEADATAHGQVRVFGALNLPFDPSLPPAARQHWSLSERGQPLWAAGPEGKTHDIKWIWEPARLGWVFPLGRAYRLTGDERFAQAFWQSAQAFFVANPPNLGPQWASGQEVALRLLSLVFARQVFEDSNAVHLAELDGWIAAHARRIPPTLLYARSQNNNHLLSEALGLYAAGLILQGTETAEARTWRTLGWKWLNRGFQRQIKADGTYVQHSTNYQRLMLQLGLWAAALARLEGTHLPEATVARLRAAVAWLSERTDPLSGEMTNLGANDGALILPLAQADFRDARPTLQAASRMFCGQALFPPGPWDELALWLDAPPAALSASRQDHSPARIDAPNSSAWGSLRAVHFTERPSHADQLHVELWWQGVNLARDAGTYLYNAAPPWDNRLTGSAVHNTVLVDSQDQMLRAGRFLWLDWAQARIIDHAGEPHGPWERVTAVQDGYRALGIQHMRSLEREGDHLWRVTDHLTAVHPASTAVHQFQLHWLVPDWTWNVEGTTLTLHSERSTVIMTITAFDPSARQPLTPELCLVRAGARVHGNGPVDVHQGWYAPTYGVRQPTLALVARLRTAPPLDWMTTWHLLAE